MKTEINGRDSNSPKARPTTMDEIWGFKTSQFPTINEDEYIAMLKKMNKSDLQAECLRIHEIPHDERTRMLDKLLKQFRRWAGATKNATVTAKPIPNTDKTAAARRVIADMTGSVMSEF